TMSNYRGTPFRRGGSMYTFDLTDGAETIHVITFAKPPCVSGTVTVEGAFEQVKRRVKVSYSSDEITAWTVTCLPDTADPRGPTGRCPMPASPWLHQPRLDRATRARIAFRRTTGFVCAGRMVCSQAGSNTVSPRQ